MLVALLKFATPSELRLFKKVISDESDRGNLEDEIVWMQKHLSEAESLNCRSSEACQNGWEKKIINMLYSNDYSIFDNRIDVLNKAC